MTALRKSIQMLLLTALSLVPACTANAATLITEIYSGTVSSVSGPANLFSAAKVGDKWTTTYTFDTDLGTLFVDGPPLAVEVLYGGTAYFSPPSPLVSATISIGSESYSTSGGYADSVAAEQDQPPGTRLQTGSVAPNSATGQNYINSRVTVADAGGSNVLPARIPLVTDHLDYLLGANDYGLGEFVWTGIGGSQYITADITRVQINPLAAVPEPATWALFILGFGTIGAFLRAKRQSEGLLAS